MSPKKTLHTRRALVPLTDLAPNREITGGSQRRVFGTEPVAQIPGSAKKRSRDLSARKDPKAGQNK
jgi:hypothetical protein